MGPPSPPPTALTPDEALIRRFPGVGTETGRGRLSFSPVTAAALRDGLVAGVVAGTLSGAPSTALAIAKGGDPFEAVRAAGSLLIDPDAPPATLVVAGALAHAFLSLGWATLFALALPSRRTVPAGVAGGLAVAALDFGVVGRRYSRIRALPAWPQIADHLAFGALAGAVVARRRRQR